ncbi:complex I subunit 4 family protein [Georgenia sp. Z1491]|uniref:complex I subunit 4 family protein n=1 Tax=Georgenia sp. Z1491 TaxID=3416707 RepID=UPI003CF7E10F
MNTATLPWLTLLVAVPVMAGALLFVPALRRVARPVGLGVSLLVLLGAIAAVVTDFDLGAAGEHQLTEQVAWIPQIGASYALGIDGLGLTMVLLTAFLVPVVLISGVPVRAGDDEATTERRTSTYVGLVLVLEGILLAVFAARDVFLFYVLFEAMLLPIFLLIGMYGGPRRRAAAIKFLLYSLAGGLIMLAGVVALYLEGPGGPEGFLVENLAGTMAGSSDWAARLIFLAFLVAFAIKAPMVPVHTWLPDAAEQSPGGVSTLLVGVMDKVGTFGMITLLLTIFPEQVAWAAPVMIVLAVISVLYGAFLAIGQQDVMRLVAFTSVSHFGFIVLGVFVGSELALTGAMFYMVAHGLSTAGMFLGSEYLVRRGGTQRIGAFGGYQRVVPVLAGTWLVMGLASIALPGLSGFWGEYMVLLGTFEVSWVAAAFAVLGVVLAALYVLMPYQRIFTGPAPLAATPARATATVGAASGNAAPSSGAAGTGTAASDTGSTASAAPDDDAPPRPLALPDLDGRERTVMGLLVAAVLALGLFPAPVVELVRPVAEQTVVLADDAGDTASQPSPITTVGSAL